MASRKDYDKVALTIVATDRTLARAIIRAERKLKPPSRELVLLAAALVDSLDATRVTDIERDAGRLAEQTRTPRKKTV